jgi:hypothetical protein
MVISAWLLVALLAVMPATEAVADQAPPVEAMVVAVRAVETGRGEKYCDPRLEPMKSMLFQLPYDTFEQAAYASHTVAFGQEAGFPLTPEYTLLITPLEKDSDGRVKLRARVQMKGPDPGRPPVNAINSVTNVVPGDRLQIRGLPLEHGELVLFLSIGTQRTEANLPVRKPKKK